VTRQQLRQRYEKLDCTRQLGNLASTLARIASCATDPRHDSLVTDLLREAALFIEWSAPQVPTTLLPDLAAMQRELMAWRRGWPFERARPVMTLYARNASDRLLRMAGLVPTSQASATALREQQQPYGNMEMREPRSTPPGKEHQ
jgi:hypothetical protein